MESAEVTIQSVVLSRLPEGTKSLMPSAPPEEMRLGYPKFGGFVLFSFFIPTGTRVWQVEGRGPN